MSNEYTKNRDSNLDVKIGKAGRDDIMTRKTFVNGKIIKITCYFVNYKRFGDNG